MARTYWVANSASVCLWLRKVGPEPIPVTRMRGANACVNARVSAHSSIDAMTDSAPADRAG